MMLLGFIAAAAAECAAPVAPIAVADTAARAKAAFAGLDAAAFDAAVAELASTLPCLDTPLTPAQAADVHLVDALRAFVAQDEAGTVAAFQAHHAADPEADPATWLPARHPALVERRYALRLDEADPRDLISSGGAVWVDGVRSEVLVPSRPAVLQAGDDHALTSTWWHPGEPLPERLSLREPRLSPRVQRHLWLGSTALVAAGAATGLALWSSSLRDEYRDPDTPYDELDTLADTNAAAGVAAAGTGLVALGLGAALVVTW